MEGSEESSVSNPHEELGLGLQSPDPDAEPALPSDPDPALPSDPDPALPSNPDLPPEEIPSLHDELQNLAIKEDEKDDESEENGKDNENNVENNDYKNENENENIGDESVEKKEEEEKEGEEEVLEEDKSRTHQYPVRPDAEDCAFYLRTGTCKFGSNCKFNHPVRRKNQAVKEKVKEREEFPERPGQAECKYYLRTGGCKFGKGCRYNHTRGKSTVAPILEFNFSGLPIRPGEKECPYYMRTGCCKYGSNCRFNHPDPTAGGGCDPSSGGSVPLQGASQSTMASWPSPGTLNETASFVPMMFSPTPSQNPEWNGYQASVYPSERSMHPSPAYVVNNSTIENSAYTHHQQMLVEEFPERPGQPECSYFLKTGDCKYRSACRYHHPKYRIPKSSPCAFSDKGLPLRPDQNTCAYYERYGICKFGPACKFNHPINHSHSASSAMSGPVQPPSFGNSATTEGARMTGSGNVSEALIQQPV